MGTVLDHLTSTSYDSMLRYVWDFPSLLWNYLLHFKIDLNFFPPNCFPFCYTFFCTSLSSFSLRCTFTSPSFETTSFANIHENFSTKKKKNFQTFRSLSEFVYSRSIRILLVQLLGRFFPNLRLVKIAFGDVNFSVLYYFNHVTLTSLFRLKFVVNPLSSLSCTTNVYLYIQSLSSDFG